MRALAIWLAYVNDDRPIRVLAYSLDDVIAYLHERYADFVLICMPETIVQ